LQGRMLRRTLAVLALAALGFGGWLWFRWHYPHVLLDPEAEIDPERKYTLDVWVAGGTGLVKIPDLDAEFWSEAVGDFQSLYPNVDIVLKAVASSELEREMLEAADRRKPPHILVAGGEWFRLWSKYQLPIDRFLPAGERERYVPGALQRAAVGGNIMAWPSHIQARFWAANRRQLGKLSPELAAVLEGWRTGTLWAGDDMQAVRDKLLKLKGVGQKPLAYQFGSSAALVDLAVTVSGGLIGPKGELRLTKELLTSVLELWLVLQSEEVVEVVQGTLLADFFAGKRAAIGPVGLWIWTLKDEAALRGYRALAIPEDIMLLPPPGGGGSGTLLGSTVEVAVFARRPFQGPAHARLAMELARDLSRKLGLELARSGFGIPAYKPLWDEWLSSLGWGPDQRANLEAVLELPEGLPPLSPKWHEARRRLIEELLIPGLEDFVHGKAGLEIAEQLEGEMRVFLANLQGRPSQGNNGWARNIKRSSLFQLQ